MNQSNRYVWDIVIEGNWLECGANEYATPTEALDGALDWMDRNDPELLIEVWISSPVRSRKPVLMNTTRRLIARMHSYLIGSDSQTESIDL